MTDAFFSYASEDKDLASKIVQGLLSSGFRIWFAPIDLKVGQQLLDEINNGLRGARSSILLVSQAYLEKDWTHYEMDVLLRMRIEGERMIFPIWHNVSKEKVAARHVGLAGIVSLQSSEGVPALVNKLTSSLAPDAATIGVIPSWESPKRRFLQGRGEINLRNEDGPCTTIWEFLIHAKDNEYPLYIEGELYSKERLLLEVAQLLPHAPEIAEKRVGEEGKKRILQMCKDAGVNPVSFA